MRSFAYKNENFEKNSYVPQLKEGNPCYQASVYDSTSSKAIDKHRRRYPIITSGFIPTGRKVVLSHNAVSVSLQMGNRYAVQDVCCFARIYTGINPGVIIGLRPWRKEPFDVLIILKSSCLFVYCSIFKQNRHKVSYLRH